MSTKAMTISAAVLVFLLALGLTLYPLISNQYNQQHQSQIHTAYQEQVEQMEDADILIARTMAVAYNEALKPGVQDRDAYSRNALLAAAQDYDNQLDITGSGIMGYVDIPKISVTLPIYHGTDEGVLQIAVGHIEGSSLPVGGLNTHCVLSGHRGLPSAKLFSNLDKLEEGDIFMIRTLDQTLTYEVDQIRIVLPEEIDDLKIVEGEDLCTLVTCTPYGINTHRLLVRGHRVANQEDAENIRVTAPAFFPGNDSFPTLLPDTCFPSIVAGTIIFASALPLSVSPVITIFPASFSSYVNVAALGVFLHPDIQTIASTNIILVIILLPFIISLPLYY